MRLRAAIFLCALCAFAQAPSTNTKATELLAPAEGAPVERKLAELLRTQDALFEKADAYSKEELSRALSALAADYAGLLADYPDNLYLKIHYAKFLKTVGEPSRARRLLREVMAVRDDIGVVYQQLANIHAEQGDYATAWPLLIDCVRLEPEVAVYRYQMGEFLAVFRDHLVADGYMTRSELDAKMLDSFEKALALDPSSRALAWRYAQAFYDADGPDWARALAAWETAERLSSDPLEAPFLRLHKARCLIALKRYKEAAALLAKPVPPSLETAREGLKERIPKL